jgi:hypothetical protein
MWVREASETILFFTDLKVMECVEDEKANKCGLNITTVPLR